MEKLLLLLFLLATMMASSRSCVRSENVPCAMDIALLDLQGSDFSVHDLCDAAGNKVSILIQCTSGSRDVRYASLNPCLEHQPFVTMAFNSSGHEESVKFLVELSTNQYIVDIVEQTFQPSLDSFTSHQMEGSLRGTRFNFAIAQRCETDNKPRIAPSAIDFTSLKVRSDSPDATNSLKAFSSYREDKKPSVGILNERRKRDVRPSATNVAFSTQSTEGFLHVKLNKKQHANTEVNEEPVLKGDDGIVEKLAEENLLEKNLMERVTGYARETEGSNATLENAVTGTPFNTDELEMVSSGEGMQHIETELVGHDVFNGNLADVRPQGVGTTDEQLTAMYPSLLKVERVSKVAAKVPSKSTTATVNSAPAKKTSPSVTADSKPSLAANFEKFGLIFKHSAPSSRDSIVPGEITANAIDNFVNNRLIIAASEAATHSPLLEENADEIVGEGKVQMGEVETDRLLLSSRLTNSASPLSDSAFAPAQTDSQKTWKQTEADSKNDVAVLSSSRTNKIVPIAITTPIPQKSAILTDNADSSMTGGVEAALSLRGTSTSPSPATSTPPSSTTTSAATAVVTVKKTESGKPGERLITSSPGPFFPSAGISASSTAHIDHTATTENEGDDATSKAHNTVPDTATEKPQRLNTITTTTSTTNNNNNSDKNDTNDNISHITTKNAGSEKPQHGEDTAKPNPTSSSASSSIEPSSTTGTITTPASPQQQPDLAPRTPSSGVTKGLEVGITGNSSRLTLHTEHDDFQDDTFWPIVAALVIGIPSIIVFGIAITVIHKRRLASPSRLRAASMYPSL